MHYSFIYIYFFLEVTAFVHAAPIWVRNFTISDGIIIFTNSNLSTSTIWKVKNGQNTLSPCYYNFTTNSCKDLSLPTNLNYNQVSAVKEQYDSNNGVLGFLFEGSKGEMCFKFPTSTRCFEDGNSSNGYQFRYSFGESNLIVYSLISYDNQSSILSRNIISPSGYIRTYLHTYTIRKGQHLAFNQGYINVLNYDNATAPFSFLQLTTYEYLVSTGALIQLNKVVYSIQINPQFFSFNWNVNKFKDNIYCFSLSTSLLKSGLIQFTLANPINAQFYQANYFQTRIYDKDMMDAFAYIISDIGLLQYEIASRVLISATPLNIIDLSKAALSTINQSDILLVSEREGTVTQIYQYQNFHKDLANQQIVEEQEEHEEISEEPQQARQENNIENGQSSFSKICLNIEQSGCSLFCKDSCLQCSGSPFNCSLCKPLNYLNDQNDCVLSPSATALTMFLAGINLFRPQKIQQMFFFISNLDNYNYHQSSYTGFFKQTLVSIDSLQDEMWSLLPFDKVKNWMEKPFPILTYTPYTPVKFQQLQRSDSLLFQNTKEFIIVYFVSTIILFVLLNRLFHLLSHLKISKYIRIFSFWLYALFLIFFQNWQQLLALSLFSLFNTFSLDFPTKMTQLVSLFLISFVFILCASIFPMLLYLYNKKSTYFLSNISFTKYSWVIMTMQFVLIPGIEIAIHICLTEHPAIQKILLFSNGTFFIIVFLILFTKHQIFCSKGSFCIELILRSLLVLLNIVLYFRYDCSEDTSINEVVEECIETVLYCFIGMIVMELVYPILDLSVKKLIENAKQNNKQSF